MTRNTDVHSITSLTATTPPRRRAPLIIGAVAAAALVFGGAGAAFAATTDSASDSSSDSSSAAERPAHVPHIHGTVVSVSGGTVTVTDKDGFTRTILTSGDTEYGDDLTADLAAGTEIHASGTVNSNGTSLDATKIVAAPAGPADGEGPRGPHGDGEHPTPGTDAPAPSGTDAPSDSSGSDS